MGRPQLAVALVVLAGLPSLAGVAVSHTSSSSSSSGGSSSTPAASTLTFSTHDSDTYLAVNVTGPPPRVTPAAKPTKAATLKKAKASTGTPAAASKRKKQAAQPQPETFRLVSANGKDTGFASVALTFPTPHCRHQPVLHVVNTQPGQNWCVHLAKLPSAAEVTGTLTGASDALALTVDRPHPFAPLPLLCSILGLITGTLAIFIPKWLAKRVHKARIDELLQDNDQAGADTIRGLDEWVRQQQQSGTTDDTLLPLLVNTLKYGPAGAKQAREALGNALLSLQLNPDSPYQNQDFLIAAQAVLDQPNQRADFIDDDGHPVKTLALRAWAPAVTQLGSLQASLDAIKGRVDELTGPAKIDAEAKLTAAAEAFAQASKPDALADVQSKVAALESSLPAETAPGQEGWDAGAAGLKRLSLMAFAELPSGLRRFGVAQNILGGGPLQLSAAAERSPEERALARTRPADQRGKVMIWMLRVLTGVLLGVVAVWAIVQLKATVYDAKATFGSPSDYLALVTAAVGSGAAGAFIALLDNWAVQPQSDGS